MREHVSDCDHPCAPSSDHGVAVLRTDQLADGGLTADWHNGRERIGALFRPERSTLWSSVLMLPMHGTASDILGIKSKPRQRQLAAGGRPLGGTAKRIMDIAIASVMLVALAPLMIIVAVLVAIFMGSPVVFAQRRVGCGRQTFVCYKFRTMVVDGDRILREHLERNPDAAHEWNETRKLRHDPRVSCLGHLLRKSSIDELPQLFNVLRGDMSCVGPRPLVEEEIGNYGIHARECFSAKPGLTGIWQVSGRTSCSYARRIALDRAYVRRWSIWLDLLILAKTLPAVLKFDEAA